MIILLNAVLLNALMATGLALLVWTAGAVPAVHRRPGLRHVLWFIVLLKLVTPPMLEVSILPPSFVAEPERQVHRRGIPLNELARNVPAEPLLAPSSTIPLEMRNADRPARRIDWMVVLAVVSGLGTLTVLFLSIKHVWKLRRALAKCAADQRLREIVQQSAQLLGLSTPPVVSTVSANISPMLWVRRSGPLVVIPRRLADQMSDGQLRCVISHEIAHYLRRDHWTNLLSLLVAAICWWNPVAWWARRELRTAQEMCCDALVLSRSVATRRIYAEALFRALDFIQAEGSVSPALASHFGGISSTQRRFEMIANSRVSHRLSRWSYPVVLAALTVLLCVPTPGQSDESNDSEAPRQTGQYHVPVGGDHHAELEPDVSSGVELAIADEQLVGVLSGTVVYEGSPYPEPTVSDLPTGKIRSESLLVNPRNGGIANVVIFMTPRSQPKATAHAPKNFVLQARDTGFSPHVVVLRVGDTLEIKNIGTVAHNINIQTIRNTPINVLLVPGDQSTFAPSRPERWPVSLTCSIKSWMAAWLVVTDSPHVTVSDENGRFEYRDVAPGEYDITIWHERIGPVKEVELGSPKVIRTAKGYMVRVEKDSHDVGRLAIPARLFDIR